MTPPRKIQRILLLVAGTALAAGAAAAVGLLAFLAIGQDGTAEFAVVERATVYNVDDAGLGDLDGDGTLDRWTTNHSAEQRIWSRNDNLAITQDPAIPDMGPNGTVGTRVRPSRIFIDESAFVAETGPGARLAGTLRVPWRTDVNSRGDASAEITACVPEPDCTEITFSASDGGSVRMTPVPAPSDGFPVSFSLAPETDLETVQLGRLDRSPPGHTFTYHSKDRHGLALAEIDGAPALFISRGGARGLLAEVHPDARDEFLVWRNGNWQDETVARGLQKAGCPGRQATWIDIDGDGLLDLYQVCGRTSGANSVAANRLYLQAEDGSFREAAAEYGLGLDGNGSFRFFRAAPGAPLSLLWATDTAVTLLEGGDAGRFAERWSLPRTGFSDDKVTLGDVDGDGRREALIFSPRGNLALPLTAEEAPAALDLGALGLPRASTDGALVDADGDGRTDVFTVPQGLHRGTGAGFVRTDLVDVSWAPPQARIAWFDRDEDGDLDLWILVEGGADWPWGLRGLFRRAPDGVQQAISHLVGRHPLASRYWLSEVHENRLDHGRTRRIPAQAGEAVTLVTDGPGGERTEILPAGRDDTSRFSATLHDVFVTIPEGRTLVSATTGAL